MLTTSLAEIAAVFAPRHSATLEPLVAALRAASVPVHLVGTEGAAVSAADAFYRASGRTAVALVRQLPLCARP